LSKVQSGDKYSEKNNKGSLSTAYNDGESDCEEIEDLKDLIDIFNLERKIKTTREKAAGTFTNNFDAHYYNKNKILLRKIKNHVLKSIKLGLNRFWLINTS
jgi:hypothetical protein